AQLWLPPAAIATTPPVRPVGWTGWAELATFEPSPSWWKKLPPQHQTPPPTSAQVWLSPAAMATTPLVRFATWTMWEELGAVTLGLPSWPEPLTPQHLAEPLTIAQVCEPPAGIAWRPLARPWTPTAEWRSTPIESSPI